ncbi:MAG TPA: tetratricopeptide repeat protein [Gammaproteobacteria bacterium]
MTIPARPLSRSRSALLLCLLGTTTCASAQQDEPPAPLAHPADLAFEQGRWEDAIAGYRELLAEYPEDRLSLLRIAQAERELGRHEAALETLEAARAALAPEAMIEVERALDLAALGRRDEALEALEIADHVGTRAREVIEQSPELEPLHGDPRYERIVRNVRARVHPCTGLPEASQFDFWLGRWEVRNIDGTLIGYDTITKRDGDCSILEQWERQSGSTGTSLSFFVPSRGQWRHVWTGSGGTVIELTGELRETGEMHMEGTLEYVTPEQVVALRATWTPLADGRVRQRIEQFDVVAQGWVVWFDGVFRPLGGQEPFGKE